MEAINRHVEALWAAKLSAQPTPRDAASWRKEIGADLTGKLAAVGLIEAAKRAALGELLRPHILLRPDVMPSALQVWQQPCRNLISFFGDDKPLRSITAGDADQFKAWLLSQNLATATVAKRHADWERERITVPSPKTDRYEGKGCREVPLFAERRHHLEEAYELADPGQTYVVGGKTETASGRPHIVSPAGG